MEIKTIGDFRRAVRMGPYAWPGGYPLYWVLGDGGALKWDQCKDRFVRREMLTALRDTHRSDQWRPVAVEINYEDADLYCDHTSERIECAYGDDTPSA